MTAFTSGAEGLKPNWLTGLPLGYQPSSKYWRTNIAAPATIGVAMDVPMSIPTSQLFWPTLPLLPLHRVSMYCQVPHAMSLRQICFEQQYGSGQLSEAASRYDCLAG
jgi:hypothetical protein